MRRFAWNLRSHLRIWWTWTTDAGQEAESKLVRPRLQVFWFNKDNPTEHRKMIKKKKQTEDEMWR